MLPGENPHHLELTHGAGLQLSVKSRPDPRVPLKTTRGTWQLSTGHFWGLPGLEMWICANLSVYSRPGRVLESIKLPLHIGATEQTPAKVAWQEGRVNH